MQEIAWMVRSLCLLTPAFLLLKTLLPAGDVQRYAAFVLALIEMGVLARPLLILLARLGG